jgi:prepilin-type N-terminal cleavage/methylation domain-containing protein
MLYRTITRVRGGSAALPRLKDQSLALTRLKDQSGALGRVKDESTALIRLKSQSGFTLIELLVVILIIGVLAAIAIPAFLSQTKKANDAAAKTQVGTLQTTMKTYAIENAGSYAGARRSVTHLHDERDGQQRRRLQRRLLVTSRPEVTTLQHRLH